MDRLKTIANDIKSGWDKIEKKKKIQLVVSVIAIILILFVIIYFTQRTEYKVLFSDLEEADAGAIVEDLESRGMEYQLEDDGTTILIDEDLVDEYRIDIAVDGPMPSTTTGFEIFDESSMMATEEDRNIMYQRAVSGELERAIMSIDSMESAKVILNIPESSVFENPEYQSEASASVVIETSNGQSPASSIVQGITALVSGAVDNLPADNVEIVDTNGNLLSSSTSGSANVDVVTEHQRIQTGVEEDLENQVKSLLGPVFGSENVHITVNAQLNFDAIERQVVEYGDGQYIRSQSESVTGDAALASQVQGGVLDEDTTNVVGDAEEDDGSSYNHSTNYEIDTTTSQIVEAPGAIERITASVIITGNPSDRAAIEGLVENALGIDEFRGTDDDSGDSLQIEYLTNITDETEDVDTPPNFMDIATAWLSENWWLIALAVVLLILLIGILRMIFKRHDEEEEDYEDVPSYESFEEPEEVIVKPDPKIEKQNKAHEKEDEIREQSKENPELAAELIKIWLKEDGE